MMAISGTSFQFIWPGNPWWHNFSSPLFLDLMMISVGIFFVELMELRKKAADKPYRQKLYKILMSIYCLGVPLLIISLLHSYRFAIVTGSIFAGIILIFLELCIIFLIIRERSRNHIITQVSLLFVFVGGFTYALKSFGILPTTFFTEWSVQIGSVFMVVIFSFSLSDRVNIMRKNLNVLAGNLKNKTVIISSMLEFANRINSLSNLDEIFDSILETVTELIDCNRISIMLLSEDKQSLVVNKSIGVSDQFEKKTRIKIGEGIAGKVFEKGELTVINDLESEGFKKDYSEYDSFISAPFICSPLAGPNLKLGVINVTNKRNNMPITDDDADIISYISKTASIAINNQLNEVKIEESYLETIKSLAGAIEAKDSYTRGHSDRVSKLSVGIAIEMGLSMEEIRILKFAGILHDIGKIGILEIVLRKPDTLNAEEYELIKTHPSIGENILKDIKFLEKAKKLIRHHHERFDGSGYPNGLKGNDIPLGARIIAVADTFDAMNSDRPYRNRIDYDTIIEEIKKASGKALDADCVNCLLKYLEDLKETYGETEFI